jgi:hypothetical protein
MVKKWIILYCLLINTGLLHAQQGISIEAGAWTNYRLAAIHTGADPGGNGAGISVGLNTTLRHGIAPNVSGELGAAGTGFYIAGSLGAGMQIPLSASDFIYTPGISVLQGAGLFRPDLLYMWGLEQSNVFSLRLKNTSMPGILLALRYYGFPGYSEYSEINHFLDLRLGLVYRF